MCKITIYATENASSDFDYEIPIEGIKPIQNHPPTKVNIQRRVFKNFENQGQFQINNYDSFIPKGIY